MLPLRALLALVALLAVPALLAVFAVSTVCTPCVSFWLWQLCNLKAFRVCYMFLSVYPVRCPAAVVACACVYPASAPPQPRTPPDVTVPALDRVLHLAALAGRPLQQGRHLIEARPGPQAGRAPAAGSCW